MVKKVEFTGRIVNQKYKKLKINDTELNDYNESENESKDSESKNNELNEILDRKNCFKNSNMNKKYHED